MVEKQIVNRQIQLLRCISMIFIVLCHFFQYYDNELAWWFNVGVQIFFIISGFLYGNKDIINPIEFLQQRFFKILLPYYVFLIPVIGMYYFFAREYLSFKLIIGTLFCSRTIKGIGHLWFVGYILFCYFITPYLYYFKEKIKNESFYKMTSKIIILLLMVMILSQLFDFYFSAAKICCYICGYFLAFYHKQYDLKLFQRMSLIIMCITVIINGLRIYLKYWLPYETLIANKALLLFLEDYAHLLLGLSIFLIFYLSSVPSKELKILQYSDKYSYYVYLVHQLFILSPFSLLSVFSNIYLNWLLCILSILIVSVLLRYISEKIKGELNGKSNVSFWN